MIKTTEVEMVKLAIRSEYESLERIHGPYKAMAIIFSALNEILKEKNFL